MKIAIIGAGSTYTPEVIEGLIKRKDHLPVEELVLMDIDERKLGIVGGFVQRMVYHGIPSMQVRMTTELDDALKGASYVLGQIRVGRLPARYLDESIPLKYGLIGQETTGIGGFFNGMRAIPPLLHIARRMEQLCPDAWLINFSNPSGMVAEALCRYSEAKVIGLCNIPINTLVDMRKAVGDPNAIVETVGLNHLSYVTSVISHGVECLTELIEKGYCGAKPQNLPTCAFSTDCLKACGGIPNGYLLYYYERERQLKNQMEATKTRAQICMEIEAQLLEIYQDAKLYKKPELLNRRGGHLYSEAAVALIDSLYNDLKDMHTVNTRNSGVLPYLDAEEVAEIACVVDRNGPHPVEVKKQGTPHMIQMIQTVKAYERMAVEAAVHGDQSLALAALMSHPLIGDFSKAKACFEEMLEAHKSYLPQFFH